MPQPTCYDQLLKYLTRRSHGVKEVAGKLKTKGYPGHEIAEAIDRALEAGFLNDQTFAEDRVRYRADISRWGPNKIKQELKQKGISSNVVDQAFTAYEEERACGRSQNSANHMQNQHDSHALPNADVPIFAGNENPDATQEEDWKAQALEILQKRFKTWPENCRPVADSFAAENIGNFDARKALEKEKSKRLNFLLRRGFTQSQALYALNKTLDDLAE